jgi:type I restriction enzyme S subunit
MEWEVSSLHSLAKNIKRGPSLSCNTNGKGIRYLTSGNLVNDEVSLKADYKFLDNFDDVAKCLLSKGDLVLNCVNSAARIGGSAIYNLGSQVIVGFNNYGISLDKETCIPDFILFSTKIPSFNRQLKAVIKDAINQVSFSTKDLQEIFFALPPLPEQEIICGILNSIWIKEKKMRASLEKYKNLKKSLMQDLLTGKVRVTVH